ncbi:MAG TPA: fumarylacetoacetate hydrolase family protein [Rhodocyclaceae bacterium]|nr:fumarylacetoacetate hydrolase family protein [Rhodocyclaceae bacterium]
MSETAALTDALVQAWRSGVPLPAATAALAPRDAAGAYAVQRRVAAVLGWFPQGRPRAWKLGMPRDGGMPTAAPVPDELLFASPARRPASGFHCVIGVEVELAVRLRDAVPAGADRHEIAQAIGETIAAIELFDVRAEQWRSLPATFLLADQQMHAGLVLGSGISGAWSDAFARSELSIEVDGRQTARPHGGHPLGDPLHLLPWLASHAAAYGDGLRAGDLVSTGSWIALYEARAGERICARFEGVGTVELEIGA